MIFFSSNAGMWGTVALGALALALVATIGDRRRRRRSVPDRVGCMPWASVFLAALFVAVIAALFALKAWLSPV
ncbi:hypothetical protein [Croceicoccus sp. BE223]|uniref:hypothetical protein n=1 Tax=Croceicoccus sp. BE223 TaxID=2817716 RepID=UPI00285EE052|nr:hypothetical protein [Croceicoccus sp. BE223]MDR7104032.1 ABC-type uncharacterized transport system permease subunit [Croceicoccus sp. BE223]